MFKLVLLIFTISVCISSIDGRSKSLNNRLQRSSTQNYFSIAKEKCNEYARYVYREEISPVTKEKVRIDECVSNYETLIVLGNHTKPKEFPHMALIGHGESSDINWSCGGSLISERFILGAAICANTSHRGPARWARLGVPNIVSTNEYTKPIVMTIVARFIHPEFKQNELYNDIALYKLDRDVTFNPYIRPICLDLGEKQTKTAIATGWGRTSTSGPRSDALLKVALSLVNTEQCIKSYANIGKQLPNGISASTMICAKGEAGEDTCQGDTGGPLQIMTNEPYCIHYQIGITSFGKGCGSDTPGVYTKVSHYVRWIVSLVWP